MGEANIKRSQAIFRMPVDMVDAVMLLHDGDRSDVLLFVPPSEDISRLLRQGNAFLPVMREASMCLVARESIAALGVAPKLAPALDEDLPVLEQQAKVTLRSGAVLEGTMKWAPPDTHQRTADHLNSDVSLIVLHAGERTWLIAKSHIAMVRES